MEIYMGINPDVLFMTKETLEKMSCYLNKKYMNFSPSSDDFITCYRGIPIYTVKHPEIACRFYNSYLVGLTSAEEELLNKALICGNSDGRLEE